MELCWKEDARCGVQDARCRKSLSVIVIGPDNVSQREKNRCRSLLRAPRYGGQARQVQRRPDDSPEMAQPRERERELESCQIGVLSDVALAKSEAELTKRRRVPSR